METFNTTRKILIGVCAVLCLVAPVWAYCERDVNEKKAPTAIGAKREKLADRLIVSAERWLPVRELTGNNDHPMITRAMKLCGLRGDRGYPWCAAAQAEIHDYANIPAPTSARVVDWFVSNVVWKREWGQVSENINTRGMVGALYYQHLGRYGHIVLIVGEDKHNYFTLEGNTNLVGSREGDGFYRKIRRKNSIAALADYVVTGRQWLDFYENNLQ